MSSTSNYTIGYTPSLPGRNVVLNNVECPTAQITNLSVSLINGLPPPSASPIVAPVNSILTVVSPGVANFTDSSILVDLEVDGNINLNGYDGALNQFIKKTGTNNQDWVYITPSDMSPGLVGQVLITGGGSIGSWAYINGSNFGTVSTNKVFASDGSGNADFRNLTASIISPGANNQVLTTFSGITSWNLLTQANFAPNTANTALTTNGLGAVSFSKVSPNAISPGTSYQALQTNSSGNTAEWSSTLNIDSILFTGNISNFQSDFDRYYSSNIYLPIYATALGGSPHVYQLVDALAFYTVIGKRVDLMIMPFTLASLVGGSPASCYISFRIIPNFLVVKDLRDIDNGERQATCMCNISQNNTTQFEPAYCNAYNNYYGKAESYLELVVNNAGNFVSNASHGAVFTGGPSEFMSLKAPFTISYIAE